MNKKTRSLKNKIKSLFFYYSSGKPKLFSYFLLMDSHSKYVHKLISNHIKENDTILDVGAKSFRYTKYQKAKFIIGSDLISESQGYLGWTDKDFGALLQQKNLLPTVSNCEELPIQSNSVDLITCIEVIEHVEKDEKAIAEFSRVLKKNGRIILTTPNGQEVPNTNPYHLRHYTLETLRSMIEDYFENIDIFVVFPNTKLYVKQYTKTGLKRIFLYWIYELYQKFSIHKKKGGGYTIIVTAASPKLNPTNDIEYSDDIYEILCCPKCKGKLKRNTELLCCHPCDLQYKIRDSIPYLLIKNPQHQKGNGIPPIIK